MMKTLSKAPPLAALLTSASAMAWMTVAQAAAPMGATVTLVCHESGGSGMPLTNYVNSVDFGINIDSTVPSNAVPLTPKYFVPSPLPSIGTIEYNGVLLTAIQTEADTTPTSCAIATAMLLTAGFQLVSSFSHFTGYYVEIFTTTTKPGESKISY